MAKRFQGFHGIRQLVAATGLGRNPCFLDNPIWCVNEPKTHGSTSRSEPYWCERGNHRIKQWQANHCACTAQKTAAIQGFFYRHHKTAHSLSAVGARRGPAAGSSHVDERVMNKRLNNTSSLRVYEHHTAV